MDNLDAAVKKEERDTRPFNTDRSYRADWAEWGRFAEVFKIPVLGIRSGTLAAFARWLWDGRPHDPRASTLLLAPNTIDRRLTGIVVTARQEHGLDLPRDIAADARTLLARWVKEMEQNGEQRGRGSAPALLVAHMKAISAALPDTLRGIRDRSIMTMQFAVAGREHEMAHTRTRDYPDMEPDGIRADLRVSKVSPRRVPVTYADDAEICPVRCFHAWKKASATAAEPNGYAWRRLHSRWNTVSEQGLSPEAIGDVIVRASKLAALGIRHTGHSPRRGLATEARRAGKDQKVIALQGGWAANSPILSEYLEIVDMWTDNALVGVM